MEWSEWSKYVYVSQGLELREYYAAACGHCQAAGPFASSCCCDLFSKLLKGVQQCEGAAVGLTRAFARHWLQLGRLLRVPIRAQSLSAL